MIRSHRRSHRIKKLLLVTVLLVFLTGCGEKDTSGSTEVNHGEGTEYPSLLSSVEDLSLQTEDGENYSFFYVCETYRAHYRDDTWKIYDSYRIMNHSDMLLICQALTAEHPIPDAKGSGNRTPEDLVYEWDQHNLAFSLLPEGSKWKDSARDVDLNPEDRGKDLLQFVYERTGN